MLSADSIIHRIISVGSTDSQTQFIFMILDHRSYLSYFAVNATKFILRNAHNITKKQRNTEHQYTVRFGNSETNVTTMTHEN